MLQQKLQNRAFIGFCLCVCVFFLNGRLQNSDKNYYEWLTTTKKMLFFLLECELVAFVLFDFGHSNKNCMEIKWVSVCTYGVATFSLNCITF